MKKTRCTYTLNDHYFDSIETPEQAYYLGLLSADGGISGNTGVTLDLKRSDKEHIVKFRKAINSDAPITERDYFDKRYNKTYYSAKLSVSSHAMVTALKAHGLHSKTKSVDLKPWSGPRHLLTYYWQGLMDGDGHVNNHGGVKIGLCGTREIVDGYISFVDSICPGLHPRIAFHRNNWQASYDIIEEGKIIASIFYGNEIAASFAMTRKLIAAREILARQRINAISRPVPAGHDATTLAALKNQHKTWAAVAKFLDCSDGVLRKFRKQLEKQSEATRNQPAQPAGLVAA